MNLATDRLIVERQWLPYTVLVLLYLLIHLPQVVALKDFSSLAFPLVAHYASSLLFSDGWIRGDLANALVSPANGALIYPPGIYLATLYLPSAVSLFYALFALQFVVPLLLYRMLSACTSPTVALLAASLGLFFFTRSDWVAPDFVIQPFMMITLLLLLPTERRTTVSSLMPVVAGLLTGIVMVFKQNIGVFLAILCGTLFFLASFRAQQPGTVLRGRREAFSLLSGFCVFALVFGSRLLHWDEIPYYLLPYVVFWLLFVAFLRSSPLSFDVAGFTRQSLVYGTFTLLLPAAVFLAFGSIVGYGRYWHALFGMGLKFLHIWDHGIVGMIRNQVSFASLTTTYQSLAMAPLFVMPLAVNAMAVGCLCADSITPAMTFATRLLHFRVAALGIMATFMFFPLEGYHILSTKLFIYVWVGLFFLERSLPRAVPAAATMMALALVPVVIHALSRPVAILRMETATGTPDLQQVIGMPMQKDIARELASQVDVLRRTILGAPYFIVDSSGGILIALAALVDTVLPQYYIEMRNGILDREVTEAIKTEIATRPFVVVNADDFERRNASETDPYLREIIAFIGQRFTAVDLYRPPVPKPASFHHLLGFIIMKNRSDTGTR